MKAGDQILRIDNFKIEHWRDLQGYISDRPDQRLELRHRTYHPSKQEVMVDPSFGSSWWMIILIFAGAIF